MSHDRKQEGQSQPAGVWAPSSRTWLSSGDFSAEISDCPRADSLGLKNKRSDSEEPGQKHSQHHARSFFNHDQMLPKAEQRNSKVYLAPNGSGDMSSVSPTSDRVTNGSY